MNIYSNDLVIAEEPVFKRFLPIVKKIDARKKINEWDIPYTIGELSYLVHSHYRYYGKFPSVVAGQLLEQFPPPSPDHYILDNFCGSGTSLVEAKLRGIKSYGVDISWLAVLASKVKVTNVNILKLKKELDSLVQWFEANQENFQTPTDPFVQKWFNEDAAADLSGIQQYILKMRSSPIRDFLIIGFIGIVRRTSKAHDAEVRPHINKLKKQRDVISAFSKKIVQMCSNQEAFQRCAAKTVDSVALLRSNLDLPEIFSDKKCYLTISHPPYLNSFNYASVFNMEFYWGKAFEKNYTNKASLYKEEMKAHPANESITESYFLHLQKCYEEVFRIQPKGAYLAVVIGDCTRNGKHVPVISTCIEIIKKIGYKLYETNYRTTHYGLGKYAYKHRADYHGDNEEKKDGIIIFKK